MAARFWVGGTGSWGETLHWSTTSGGSGGASVPTSADTVTLNAASGGGTVTLDSTQNVSTLTLTGFTGTLDFFSNVIFVNGTGAAFTGDTTYTATGNPRITFVYAGATAMTVNPRTPTEANSISLYFSGAGTYGLTITSGSAVNDISFGYTGIPIADNLTVYGNVDYPANFATSASPWTLASTSATVRIIYTNGATIDRPLVFNGSGGKWSINDALTMGSTRSLTHTNGTINLNGNTLTVGTSYTTAAGTKNLTFNGGTLVCPAVTTTAFNNAAPTNFTTTAGTGTGKISLTGATAKTFVGGGSTYNCTLSNDGAGALTISGSNTFTSIANGVQPTTFSFTAGTTTTVTNWDVNGISGSLVTVNSATAATHTISKSSGTVLSQYVSITNSTATGGATWYAGATSTNGGGNTGWVFGTTKYWVGGSGNWSTAARWSATSGGGGGVGPLIYPDAAVFDASSGAGTATLDSNVTCLSLTMTGYTGTLGFGTNSISLSGFSAAYTGATTYSVSGTPVINMIYSGATATTISCALATEANAISFNFSAGSYNAALSGSVKNIDTTGSTVFLGTSAITVYGDFTLGTGSSTGSSTGIITFASTSATPRLITMNGLSSSRSFTFNGVGGTWKLAGTLTISNVRTTTLTNGTLDLNGQTMTAGLRFTTAAGTKNLTFNGGTLICANANITSFNNAAPTGFTTTAGTGTGKISMTAATAKTFVGGGSTYNCTLSNDGAGALTISGSNTFTTIANGVQPTAFTFTAATTQTVTNWNVSGTAGNLVTIISSTAGVPALLSKASGTVSSNYLSLKDSTATGGATWYAGANSTNVSGNSGWIFSNAPSNAAGSFFFMF